MHNVSGQDGPDPRGKSETPAGLDPKGKVVLVILSFELLRLSGPNVYTFPRKFTEDWTDSVQVILSGILKAFC